MKKIFSYKFKTNLMFLFNKLTKFDFYLLFFFMLMIFPSNKHYDIKDLNASIDHNIFKSGLLYKINGSLIYKEPNFFLVPVDSRDSYSYKIILKTDLSKNEFSKLKEKINKNNYFLLKLLNSDTDIKRDKTFNLKLIKIL